MGIGSMKDDRSNEFGGRGGVQTSGYKLIIPDGLFVFGDVVPLLFMIEMMRRMKPNKIMGNGLLK
ncbi:MAG: hypothetical protein KQH59_06860 [Desulfobulbaceae bacterium]|nr:hypothetical protein [Desulfobulbaceae bacterium]